MHYMQRVFRSFRCPPQGRVLADRDPVSGGENERQGLF